MRNPPALTRRFVPPVCHFTGGPIQAICGGGSRIKGRTYNRERWIDPTITAAADVHLPDGTVLVRAGESINPLDRVPFTQRLVIFDASDRRQLAFAKTIASKPSDKPTTFLLTGIHHKGGWNELTDVMDQLQRRVYLLTPELRERFSLDRVPAIVEAVGRQFRVREVAMVGSAGEVAAR